MENFPHHYKTLSLGKASGPVVTNSRECSTLLVAEPKEFDGSGDHWSPEQLFVGIIADCLILTFRAITKASKFEWVDISCEAQGKLERIDRVNKFTQINIEVTLTLSSGADENKANRLLDKAENQCLIKNSINAQTNFIKNIVYQ